MAPVGLAKFDGFLGNCQQDSPSSVPIKGDKDLDDRIRTLLVLVFRLCRFDAIFAGFIVLFFVCQKLLNKQHEG